MTPHIDAPPNYLRTLVLLIVLAVLTLYGLSLPTEAEPILVGWSDTLDVAVTSMAAGVVTVVDDFLDTEIAAIKAKTDNLPAAPADQSAVEAAITAATSGLATAAALDVVDNLVDTEVAAIKAVTDKLDTALELNGAVYRYTTNALELAPSGGGGGLDAAGVRGRGRRVGIPPRLEHMTDKFR